MLGRESRAAAPNRSEHLELNSGSTRLIPRLYTVAHGNGQTTAAPQASVDEVVEHERLSHRGYFPWEVVHRLRECLELDLTVPPVTTTKGANLWSSFATCSS